ncbi:hypothetical protein [Rhizobium halophytocola]|uniref:Uncharacterized protein n=1 Tax=Rhizobium halophytocola TaxID=735519 RepID=A0ABS4E0Q6_9HYPH|nr:hypothetical protein [Rhizobium halophytocola]MBP1851516.1 hypothetical protein [Rhizobium halophytocola]
MTKIKRTRLEKLKHSWAKASVEEQQAFVVWLGEDQQMPVAAGSIRTAAPAPIATGRYLTRETVDRLRGIMAMRGISLAEVMVEMGLESHDRSLARAMLRQTSLRLKTVEALQVWLAAHAPPTTAPAPAPVLESAEKAGEED